MDNTFNIDSPYLEHYGILGMKWGIRRYQNPDGTLTAAGRRRVKRAMKQHDVVMTTRDTHERDKEYKRFRDIVTQMYPAEIADLTLKVEQAYAIKKLSDLQTEDKIKRGLEYTEKLMNIGVSAGNLAINFANAANTVSQIKERDIKLRDAKTAATAAKSTATEVKNIVSGAKGIKGEKWIKKPTEAPKVKEEWVKELVKSMQPENNDYTILKDTKTTQERHKDDEWYQKERERVLQEFMYAKHSANFKMNSNFYIIPSNSDLQHHGILGMKWGIRRYQNKDGSLTNAGRKRYGSEGFRSKEQYQNRLNDLDTATRIIDKKIETRQNIKGKLIESKARTDSYIDFDGGTVGERVKSKLLDKAISKVDDDINRKAVNKEKGYQEMANIIQKLQDSGFKITTKPTIKNVNTGADYVANLIAGPSAALAYGATVLDVLPLVGFTGPVAAPLAAGIVGSAILGTSIYSLTKNTTKGTKFKVEEGG